MYLREECEVKDREIFNLKDDLQYLSQQKSLHDSKETGRHTSTDKFFYGFEDTDAAE